MAEDEMANEIVIPSCSNYEVTDAELITGKNRKRQLSISESEVEYNDYTDISKCETSANKKTPRKDNQSNAICKRISEQSMSDVIKKLTKQIEYIEKRVALSQNFMKNTKANDEPIYQPPNKIIKYDVEVISAESCNSDENSTRSIKNINTTKNVNKKIKLDQNIIFQKDIDDSERDSYKSLTNEEVQMLLELPYNFDDEENTHIKIHDGQTNEDDTSSKSILNKKLIEVRGDSEKIFDSDKTTDKIIDSVNIPDLADTLNTSIKHLFNGSILDNTKVGISTEDNSISQSNDCSEKSINHSGEFVNVGDVLLLMREINNDDVDNCNDAESIDQDGIMDLTNCENYEIMLNHENCTSITNKGLNSTMHFDNVNSEIQTDCEETTRCSDNSIHKTDFERIIVPEGELNDSTKHVDDQKYVCKSQNNEEKNNFESSNIEDDLFGVDILDVHSKVDCESNLNQRSLLDTNANNQTILENKNSTSNMNPGQRNERTLKRLTVQEEEMLTKLFNNDVDELGIVTNCTDSSLLDINKCEANASKISEGKRHFSNDEAFIMPVNVSEDVNYNSLLPNSATDATTVNNYDVTLSERNFQGSVIGDQFTFNMFYFGTENFRDVSVHTIQSLDGYEMNFSKNNTPVPSMENNDSLVSLNNAIENTTVELCNGEIEIETLSRMKNKNDNYGEEIVEGIIKQIIEDITVSLDSSNTFHHVLKKSIKNINTTKNVNKKIKLDQNIIFQKDIDDSERDSYKSLTNEEVQMLLELPYNFDDEENTHIKIHDGQTNEDMRDLKNILEPVHNYCMNSGSITSQEKICFVSPHETKNTGPETYEYNNNNDTSSKSILNKKLIEVRGDSEKIFDSDKTTDKIIDSVNIPDLADTLNTSIKHLFNGSILDNTKVGISTEDNSISQSNDCSEKSINHSGEFVNVGDVLLLMREINNDDVDNCNDAESIDQDGIMDLTNCENYEIMLNHENCTSITNKGLNSTMHFDNVNSEIQTDCEETTRCSDNSIHKTDFERIIVPEGELNDSTKHVDDQKYVCKTQNNEEKNNFESSNIEDDLFGVDILDFHSKVDCESNLNQRSLLDTNAYNQTILENKNSSSNMNPGQRNERTLKRPTVQGEEMLTKLFNNDIDELGIVTDCTDKVTTSQTCEDYIYENVSKKFKNEDDLLEVTMHKSDEKVGITIEEEINLSFNFDDARQILESSNDFEHFDDSLLFNTSDSRDLVRYGIECEEYEKSISQSLNNLENNVSNKEVISQCKSPSLRFNKISKSINNHVSSSFAKDYEDNVIDFYDCDLSSIENSDIEDNLLLSFENDSSIDDCIFNEKKDKLKNAINSTSNELNSLKIQNVASPSESCNNSTNVLETPVSLIHSPSHDHQNIKIMSTSMSIKQKGMNLDADDKLESFNHSDVKIITCNTIPSFNESDNINKIESDDLCKDQGELKSNSNKDQNLEVSNKNYNQNNENKSISEYNTHQNIEKSQNPYKDNGSESAKVSSLKNTENEDISKINTVESTSFDTNLSQIEKKKYLEEIIKNEQLFNKFDEELDINESTISPYISQSLVKSTNLKNALAKRAATNINIHDMGNKALFTYLTQQTMTLDLLKVLHKSLETCPSSGVLMEDPEGLVVPLMSHQKHAIAWLIWRESQEPRGGILADDMGLGKTLSMISLILKLKEKPLDSLLPLEESIGNRRNDVIIGGTLVVCPVSLINQWETEVKSKLKPGLLKVDQYYGINRNFSALELAKNDLVITSYHVVMWDHKLRQNSSPLYKIKWDRVILDEGHNIRNHKTQTSIAVCNIKSLNRWAITGTPIHNKEEDFFTLLKFVRCKPFDDWPVWKRWVSNNDDAGKHRLSLLIKTLMLRRTKTELTQLTTFNLPIKKIITIEIELSKEERNAYENLLKFSSNLFATYLYDRAAKEKLFDPSIKVQCKIQYFQEQSQDKDEVFKDHLELLKLFKQFKNIDEIQTYHILVLLLRLRQMCCHPILIKGPITEESIKKEDNMESISEDETNATYNENKDIDTSLNNIDLPDCMSCLILEDEPVEKKSVIERNIFQKTYVSSKIKKICELVNQKILINGGNDKAIIVSQWPSFLHLIKKNLAHYNTKIEMFSGKIPILRRNKIIRDFNNPDGGPRILLLSLKAGGVGLNLMAANHMFLIDVHWNPQLEAQVCDRVYRVGQTKPVYIYKFISNNTIETRILNIQTLKLQIAENLFKGTTVASSKLTIDDLKQIFQFH